MPLIGTSIVPVGPPPSSANPQAPHTVSLSSKPRLKSSSVEFSRSVFAIWWAAISLVHLTALGYHARITRFYWRLPNSPIGEMVELYDLSLPQTYCRGVAVVNASISGIHGIAVLRMIRNSARARQLVFYVDDLPVTKPAFDPASPKKLSRVRQLGHDVMNLFAYNGPLGVEGKYFDLLLYAAEFVETLLQTYQAYRVNSLVARRWLSRLYAGVLIFNCWSIPLIHVVYRSKTAHKRLLSLMCDCVLDLVSSVVVPGALFFVYLADYVPLTHSIERTRWYDDLWLVQLWSEHDLVVIASWIDALSRLVFAVGLLLSLEGVKQLLRVEAVKPQPRPELRRRLTRQLMQLIETSTSHRGSWTTAFNRRLTPLMRYNAEIIVHQLQRVRWAAIFHATLALWGIVVLGVHADAEITHASTPHLPVCPIQFSKWVHNAPVCLLLEIDCDALGIQGKAEEIQQQWHDLEPTSVLRLVFRHCAAFEMPLTLGIFSNLKSIKLYNSTVVSWNHSASFTDSQMPKIRSLQFIRVNFTDSKLPQGLSCTEFPQHMRSIEFCVTNLLDLSPEIDQIWPKGLRLSLESSHFTAIPQAALRLSPWQLSVSGNAINDVSAELFQSPGIRRIGLAHTLISSLPSNFSAASSMLRQVSITYTPVAESPPQWMDAVIERAERVPYLVIAFFASETPLCDGKPRTNAVIRSRSISCVASLDDISYPLAFEDQQSSL